jgi:cytoplasmic iron level regulating protein YaaA (DUF328/UPF0246 family)
MGGNVLILLPPSEGKATTGDGPPLDLKGLSLPGLAKPRREVLGALVRLSRGRQAVAREVLGLTEGRRDAVVRNRSLRSAPTLPAAELYTGVLYDNLGLTTLPAAARARASERVLIFSGLWGALRLDDAVPAYRLAMGVNLPPLGPLASYWRPFLRAELAPLAAGRLVVDMRSAPYAAAWRPAGETAAVRVVRESTAGGKPVRTVVSHMAKATRGEIARSLLETDADPADAGELTMLLLDLGHDAETTPTGVDVIVRDQTAE